MRTKYRWRFDNKSLHKQLRKRFVQPPIAAHDTFDSGECPPTVQRPASQFVCSTASQAFPTMQCSTALVQQAMPAAFVRATGHGRLRTGRSPSIVCMAHPRRVAKVAKQIEREVGNLLITDKVLQAAVCPERRRGFDGALSALASVTEVAISNDLQVAKVYVSLYSDDVGKAAAMEGLQRLEGYVRKHIGKQIRLRLTPEIRFIRDDSIERSERIFKLLDQVKKIESGEAEPPPLAFYGEVEEEWELDEEEDWEEEASFATVDLGMFGQEHEKPAASTSGRPGAAAGAAAAAGGGPGRGKQQQQRGSGAGKQQQAAAGQQRGSPGGKGGDDPKGVEGEDDFEEMLAAFKSQVDTRRRQ